MPVIKTRVFLFLLIILIFGLTFWMSPNNSVTGETSGGGFLQQIIGEKDLLRSSWKEEDILNIGRKIKQVKEEDNGGESASSKFYRRNEKIRSKFRIGLEKIRSTCNKYGNTSDSSTVLPPTKNFSIGMN